MKRLLLLLFVANAANAAIAAEPPSFDAVRASHVSSDAQLLDRHGAPLNGVRVSATVRRLAWTALADISPAMQAALVAGEDKRFYDHAGVDWAGLAVAAWDSAWRAADGRRARGGSTLTMQLAGLLDPELKPAAGDTRTFTQKRDQIGAARGIERAWSKAQILEAYLNLASYRGDLVGIAAASQGLFGKVPSGLDARESAILVALLRAPAATPGIVAQRACAVAKAAEFDVACEAVRARASVALAGGYRTVARPGAAPHVAAKLVKTADVVSTLDASVQAFAASALRDHLAELAGRGVEDGAVVVLDNASGDVLAYVGSSGTLSRAPEVDGVVAPRQAGSTLKPFLYARALDDRILTAASLVDDSPIAIATARGVYAPQNYDRGFHGRVSVRTALASSLNVPAVRTLDLVGVARLHDDLRNLGLTTLTEAPEYYGSALALGGADVTLLALANAYRALANGGVYSEPRLRADAATAPRVARRVFGAAATFVVADILSDRGARSPTFGLDNALATRVWSAAKTGTSKDMRDNWCIGFTSRYTVGVWVGNFSGAPMHDVSGVTGAAPVFRELVHFLHRDLPSPRPVAPASLAVQAVTFDPPLEAPRHEWFLRGTTMSAVRAGGDSPAAVTPRIRYPAPGTIVALDPDIPAGHQRVALVAAPAAADLRWRIGEADLGSGGRVLWSPTRGRHRLVLAGSDGSELSAIDFEVR